MNRFFRPLVFALILAFAFAGCTRRDGNGVDSRTLRLVSAGKVRTTDPIHADDLYSIEQASQVYEGLLEYDYLKRPYRIAPLLAERLPDISADGLTYTFRLRPNATFHDDPCFAATGGKGRAVRAADVVYSIERFADPREESSMWYMFDGKIEGLNEWKKAQAAKARTDYDSPVAGLRAIDDRTVVIRLTRPVHQFLYVLAMNHAAIVARECVERYGKDFGQHPIGTGPWIAREFKPDFQMTYDRNPRYYGKYPTEGDSDDVSAGRLADAGKPLPLADHLVYTVGKESQPNWLNFLKGNFSVLGVPKDLLAEVVDPSGALRPEFSKKSVALHRSPSMFHYHFTFNMKDPLLGKNKALRQAILSALNVDELIALFAPGRATKANGFIPNTTADYDPKVVAPYLDFSLDRAKKLLAKAGYPEGKNLPPISYDGFTDSTNRQIAEWVVRSLRAAHIPVELHLADWADFEKRLNARQTGIFLLGFGLDYPDAENVFVNLWGKNQAPSINDSGYANPAFDRMYERMAKMAPGPERRKLLQEMNAFVNEEVPQAVLYYSIDNTLTQPWVRNFKPDIFDLRAPKFWRVQAP